MFDIVTSRDFLAKLEADYADFKAQPDSARYALNCVITAYHLHEWIWEDWLKTDYATWQKFGLRDLPGFREWLMTAWAGFQTAEALTNGAKHFTQAPVTERVAGYGKGPTESDLYGRPYLLIDHGSSATAQRWQTAEQLLDEGVAFWKGFFADCSR